MIEVSEGEVNEKQGDSEWVKNAYIYNKVKEGNI